jgi:hypothetical protein
MAKWLRSLFTDVTKTAVLSLLAAAAPPAALVLSTGQDFASKAHAVPGWWLLVGAGAAGLLILSITLNVMQWIRFRRSARRTLMIVAEGDSSSLWWHMGSMGESPAMQVCGGFHITNRSPYNVSRRRRPAPSHPRRYALLGTARQGSAGRHNDAASGHRGGPGLPVNATVWPW